MRVKFKITAKDMNSWSKEMVRYLKARCIYWFKQAIPEIKAEWQKIIVMSIYNSPEYDSLVSDNGQLRGELGVKDANGFFGELAALLVNSIKVEPLAQRVSQLSFKVGYKIDIDIAYSQVEALQDSSYVSFPSEERIEWVRQLLIEGSKPFPQGFDVITVDEDYSIRFVSRTGLAIMEDSYSNSSYTVPEQFAGTVENNFITRAIRLVSDQLQKSAIRIIEEKLSE
jgi:hypothetical protein